MHKLEFLGHVVSADGVEPMWDKVEAIVNLPRPTTSSEVRSFIGMATYYCRFMDHYSHVKRPLTELTRKEVEWVWGEAQELAFQKIKDDVDFRAGLSQPKLEEAVHLTQLLIKGRRWGMFESNRR